MDSTPPPLPTLCIVSVEEYKPGKFLLHMRSLWNDDGAVEVDQQTMDYLNGENNLGGEAGYKVPTCPPGYPNPPVADS